MCSPADLIRKRRSRLMNQDDEMCGWLLGRRFCDECGREIDMTAIHGVELCLNAAHFGDLAVCILCPHCDSIYYMHARKYIFKHGPFFEHADAVEFIRREKLIEAHVNNLLEMTDEEMDELIPPHW